VKRLALVLLVLGLAMSLAGSGTASPARSTTTAWWAGLWQTDFGLMKLTQTGSHVSGRYGTNLADTMTGTATGNALAGTWKEGASVGKLRFTMSADGNSFTGAYGNDSAAPATPWKGTVRNHAPKPGTVKPKPTLPMASFRGVWSTGFGVLKMTQTGAKVTGRYGSDSTLTGTVIGRVLRGTWKERANTGRFRFNMSADGKSFSGTFGHGVEPPTQPWNGKKTS
jgi:hypothetical protein